jgi:2-oxoglutarate dehydrogenase complex dehydrogenase (E1) component-like enzyme
MGPYYRSFDVRISGQDVERGTFLVMRLVNSEEEVTLIDRLEGKGNLYLQFTIVRIWSARV